MSKKRDYPAMVRKMIRGSDVVVEVIDGRFPSLSRAKKYENMVKRAKGKTLIIAMNKVDLVPRQVVNQWKRIFMDEGISVIATSARERLSTNVLKKAIIRSVKGEIFFITSCFIGLPNTGKSSLINILKGRSSAPVAPIPGFTKALQVLRITTRLRIFDTPGILPSNLSLTDKLLLGTIRPEQLPDTLRASWALVNRIDTIKPNAIKEIYGIDYETPVEFVEKFAEKRNKRKKGGELDLDTAATIFLSEHINKGKIPVWEDPNEYLRKKEEREEQEREEQKREEQKREEQKREEQKREKEGNLSF